MKALGASARVFALLDRAPALPPPPAPGPAGGGPAPPPGGVRGDVELRAVRFEYPARPGRPVIAGLSLRISAGETVALVRRPRPRWCEEAAATTPRWPRWREEAADGMAALVR